MAAPCYYEYERRSLQGPLDSSGFQAAGTDIDTPGGSFNQHLHFMDIRAPQPFRFNMRMAHLVSAGLTFTTNLTYLCHGIPPF